MKALVCIVAAVLLTGCEAISQKFTGKQPPETVSMSSEALAGPTMHVQIPSRKAEAALSRVAINADVETWLAIDNISLSFQNGILVASRGLGFDLMGADARGTLNALAAPGGEIYRRQMRFLTGEHRDTYLAAGCRMEAKGIEMVAEQPLQRFEETCRARQHSFTNLFWLGADGSVMRSKQWVAPQIGYLSTSLLSK